MKFRDMTDSGKRQTLISIIGNTNRLDLSREDASEIIRYFVSWVNKQRVEKEFSVVIINNEKRKHKLDIQEVKDSIFMQPLY